MLSSLSPLAMAGCVSQGKAPASSAPSLSHAGKVRSSALTLLRTSGLTTLRLVVDAI